MKVYLGRLLEKFSLRRIDRNKTRYWFDVGSEGIKRKIEKNCHIIKFPAKKKTELHAFRRRPLCRNQTRRSCLSQFVTCFRRKKSRHSRHIANSTGGFRVAALPGRLGHGKQISPRYSPQSLHTRNPHDKHTHARARTYTYGARARTGRSVIYSKVTVTSPRARAGVAVGAADPGWRRRWRGKRGRAGRTKYLASIRMGSMETTFPVHIRFSIRGRRCYASD